MLENDLFIDLWDRNWVIDILLSLDKDIGLTLFKALQSMCVFCNVGIYGKQFVGAEQVFLAGRLSFGSLASRHL